MRPASGPLRPEREWPSNADFSVSAARKVPLFDAPHRCGAGAGRRVAVAPAGALLHGVVEAAPGEDNLWLRIDLAEGNPLRSARGLLRCWAELAPCDDGACALRWDGPLDADLVQGAFHLKWAPPFEAEAEYVVETRVGGSKEWTTLWASRRALAGSFERRANHVAMRITWPHGGRRAAVRVVATRHDGGLASSPLTVCADCEPGAPPDARAEAAAPSDAPRPAPASTAPSDAPCAATASSPAPVASARAMAAGRLQLWPPPAAFRAAGASVLARVLWLNLDRREDRAEAQRAALAASGIAHLAERVPAVDGRDVDLSEVDGAVLTPEARDEALATPSFVLGRVLTPGGVGLWLTWHRLLSRIASSAEPHECFLVVEDDAEYGRGFAASLHELLGALDLRDGAWRACVVGYIRSKTRLRPLLGDCPFDGQQASLDTPIGFASKLCGATAVLVHGRDGAQALLDALFPVRAGCQFDLCLGGRERLCYISAVPLASAPLSEGGDSDIQRIPAERQPHFRLEAQIRQQLGDSVSAAAPELADLLGSASLTREMVAFLMEHAAGELGSESAGDEAAAGAGLGGPGGCAEQRPCEPGAGPLRASALHGAATGIGMLSAKRHNGKVPCKVDGGRVQWSLAGPFSLVGSWDDWSGMHQMRPQGGGHGRFVGDVALPPGLQQVDFQIAFGGDWCRRFCPETPEPFSAPIGPADLHGRNWSAPVPPGAARLLVTWDPAGMRFLDVAFSR